MTTITRSLTSLLALTLLAQGCTSDSASKASNEPLGIQMLRVSPELRNQKYNTLLNFETPTDIAFVAGAPSAGKVDGRHAHTGKASLLLPADADRVSVKLSAVLGDRPFPADWTLAGAFLWCARPTDVTVRYIVNAQPISQTKLHVLPGKWTAAVTELEPTPPPTEPMKYAGTLELEFTTGAGAGLRIDDVMLIDNQKTLFDGGAAGANWTIQRKGLHLACERKGAFRFFLDTTEMSDQGWTADEVGEMRARFHSQGGKTLTLYSDGRAYRDSVYRPVRSQNEDPMIAAQHDSPAEIKIDPESGRLDRRSAGDANNDGYNEACGAYQVVAAGPHLEMTITPHTPSLVRPVMEIANLPQGKIVATVEGRLVEKSSRTQDGHVLLELPSRLERATLVTIRVQ